MTVVTVFPWPWNNCDKDGGTSVSKAVVQVWQTGVVNRLYLKPEMQVYEMKGQAILVNSQLGDAPDDGNDEMF